MPLPTGRIEHYFGAKTLDQPTPDGGAFTLQLSAAGTLLARDALGEFHDDRWHEVSRLDASEQPARIRARLIVAVGTINECRGAPAFARHGAHRPIDRVVVKRERTPRAIRRACE